MNPEFILSLSCNKCLDSIMIWEGGIWPYSCPYTCQFLSAIVTFCDLLKMYISDNFGIRCHKTDVAKFLFSIQFQTYLGYSSYSKIILANQMAFSQWSNTASDLTDMPEYGGQLPEAWYADILPNWSINKTKQCLCNQCREILEMHWFWEDGMGEGGTMIGPCGVYAFGH